MALTTGVGPDVVTGPSTAATWSEVLGREVRYGGDDLDAWEEQNLRYLPPALAYPSARCTSSSGAKA